MYPIVQSPLITEQYVGKVVIGMVDDDARVCIVYVYVIMVLASCHKLYLYKIIFSSDNHHLVHFLCIFPCEN